MKQIYLMPQARCRETGETVVSRELSGRRFTQVDRREAQLTAERLAHNLAARSGRTWTAFLKPYTV